MTTAATFLNVLSKLMILCSAAFMPIRGHIQTSGLGLVTPTWKVHWELKTDQACWLVPAALS